MPLPPLHRFGSALFVAAGLLLSLTGCKQSSQPSDRRAVPRSSQTQARGDTRRATPPRGNTRRATPPRAATTSPPVRRAPARNVVLFLGDSLTAGYRLAPSEAYPALVNAYWKKHGYPWRTRNAGISGDTSAGVIRRINWVVAPEVHSVFLAIGANDGLRGQPVKKTKANLKRIIEIIEKRGVRVILAGIKLPRNYGKDYIDAFESTYPALARTYDLALMPFLLKDVAGVKELNLSDGIHPNAKGHRILANNVLAYFKKHNLFPKEPSAVQPPRRRAPSPTPDAGKTKAR